MTEDDTFRVLTQRPFKEIKRLAMKKLVDMDTIEEADLFLRKFGWTVNEFERELGIPPEERSYYTK